MTPSIVGSLPAVHRVNAIKLLQDTSQTGSRNRNGHAFWQARVKLDGFIIMRGSYINVGRKAETNNRTMIRRKDASNAVYLAIQNHFSAQNRTFSLPWLGGQC